jgi:uncharacterized protein (DUF362 family)
MPTDRPTVFLRSLENGHASAVAEGLEQVGFFGSVPANGTVFLKPNLTFPEFRPGVMTSVDCIRAVAECLTTRGFKVIIGEADGGGYNRFSMDAVFEGLGIHRLCAETGARCLNISFTDPEILELKVGWRTLRVPVPRLLLDGSVDAFITLPVPKIHMNSMVSMSIKNQWGCIQEPKERLKLHPFLSEVLFEFNRRLPRAYSIIDGRWGLNRSGPMRGDLVDLNWLLVANDLGSRRSGLLPDHAGRRATSEVSAAFPATRLVERFLSHPDKHTARKLSERAILLAQRVDGSSGCGLFQ